MWEAAPSADSQSPKPQSHDARARDGRASTNSLTRLRLKCETVTISRVSSGGCVGNRSVTKMRSDELPFSASVERNPIPPKGSAIEANLNKLRRDDKFRTQHLSHSCLRENALADLAPQASLPGPSARKMLVAMSRGFRGLEFQVRDFH